MKNDELKNGDFVYVYLDNAILMGKIFPLKDELQNSFHIEKDTYAVELYNGQVCINIPKDKIEKFVPLELNTYKMRDAIEKEQKIVSSYVKSISKPTGVNFYDGTEKISKNDIPKYTEKEFAMMKMLFNIADAILKSSEGYIDLGYLKDMNEEELRELKHKLGIDV